MNCRHAHRLFGAYWDDEITQAEREWLESHFASCAACRGEYEVYARALEALAQLPRAEATPGFADRVLARARRTSAAPDRMRESAPRWVPVAAAAALLAVSGSIALPWLAANRTPAPSATLAARAQRTPAEPRLVAPAPGSAASAPAPGVLATARVPDAADSLYDHGEDVEFILDPVTLRRGRASLNRATPEGPGDRVVVSF